VLLGVVVLVVADVNASVVDNPMLLPMRRLPSKTRRRRRDGGSHAVFLLVAAMMHTQSVIIHMSGAGAWSRHRY
jgi:hypothetical protein